MSVDRRGVSADDRARAFGRSTLDETRAFLTGLGLPARDSVELPSSPLQFPDGGHYRVEIPSVEGPAAMRTVVTEARRRRVPVHRVSQGSGIMMLTDDEIAEMVQLGQETGIEVCLFVGPRAGWDIGIQAITRERQGDRRRLRGADQLVYGIEDVRRACELGLRCVLVADVGQLWVIQQMKREGHLPDDLVVKMSVSFPVANPATARVLQDLGATTVNLPVDLSIAQVAGIRAAVETPLDMYIEAPDDLASPVRYYELPELAACRSTALHEIRGAELAQRLSERRTPRRDGAGTLAGTGPPRRARSRDDRTPRTGPAPQPRARARRR